MVAVYAECWERWAGGDVRASETRPPRCGACEKRPDATRAHSASADGRRAETPHTAARFEREFGIVLGNLQEHERERVHLRKRASGILRGFRQNTADKAKYKMKKCGLVVGVYRTDLARHFHKRSRSAQFGAKRAWYKR